MLKRKMKTLEEAEDKMKDICKLQLTYNYFEHKSLELEETEMDRMHGECATKEVCVNLSGESKRSSFATRGKTNYCLHSNFISHP